MINSFSPIIDEKCEILILGTMLGAESLRKKQYYGYGRNDFWKIIFSLFDKELSNDYEEKKAFLLENKIALWDVIKKCERETSSDAKIKNPTANDFSSLFIDYPNLKCIYFNGKKAEALYKKLVSKNLNIVCII